MATKRNMTCCVCGAAAGRWEQHWNRDTGWGICAACAAEQAGRETAEDFASYYGVPGVNFEQPTVVHMGRRFKVLATFGDDARGTQRANAYMEREPRAAVLCVVDGRVYLADVEDNGERVTE